jgi:hypothetical protein
MPRSWALGLLLLVALAAAAAAESDAPVSDQSNPIDSAPAAAADAAGAASAVNTTAECLPGFERNAATGACFQPPTCFLPMILSKDRTTCICPASDITHMDYWGGFRVINGMW